ncbi:chromate efflux transporter [Pseudodesulfovibrio piezophilus]|uniref:Chromate transporter, chromate ion transporter (CHR) family n=1 Tax=Pseudodesulfovibrio piezophilus (strain DSM 21447 / JCM 15486 / C1TLV30) TaxID=1322246 RepID=M1WKI8_PSEP2|nr:chromate efflux transporter [Pseudodesulfovibrio piezophilus]CCH49676.1 conserved membrane protein of unknown function [Pseudodesulfovibrio piezophilus C1TLV30]
MTPSLPHLFFRFLRLGLTAFGGPAMVPYIRTMAVEREQWLSEKSFRLGMSVAQVIPGATAMQMAAYVGLRSRGGPGALAAYTAFGLPAFMLMLVLTMVYSSSRDLPLVMAAFSGLQLVVVAMILHAAINFSRLYLDSLPSKLLACMAGIWLGLKGNPILALLVVCGLALFIIKEDSPQISQSEAPRQEGRPLFSAAVFLALFLLFLGILHLTTPLGSALALLMTKVDCFAFGGGYVSIPIMLHEVVEVHGWLTGPEFMDGIALGQVTPGPIVMTGAFVGYLVAGVFGATLATIAVFTPSLIFICAATPFADKLSSSSLALRALKGSLISLVGLMAAVAARFGMAVDWSPAHLTVALGAFIALRLGIDLLWVVVVGAVLSACIL